MCGHSAYLAYVALNVALNTFLMDLRSWREEKGELAKRWELEEEPAATPGN